MVHLKKVAMLGILVSAVGCSAPVEDPSTSGGSAVSSAGGRSMRAEIERCERDATDRIADAESTRERVAAGRETASCYRGVVDARAAQLDRMRGRAPGMTLRFFTSFRSYQPAGSDAPRLCGVLADASLKFGSSDHPVETASCAAEHERLLANLLAAHVDWPGESTPTPRGANAPAAADLNRLVTALAQQTLDNHPSRNTEDGLADARRDIGDAIDGVKGASEVLCDLFVGADPTGGGQPAVRQAASACRVDASAQLDSLLLGYAEPAQ